MKTLKSSLFILLTTTSVFAQETEHKSTIIEPHEQLLEMPDGTTCIGTNHSGSTLSLSLSGGGINQDTFATSNSNIDENSVSATIALTIPIGPKRPINCSTLVHLSERSARQYIIKQKLLNQEQRLLNSKIELEILKLKRELSHAN